MKTYFHKNPFWNNEEKTEAMSILAIEDDNGNVENRQQLVPQLLNGQTNPLWTKLMEEVGPSIIDSNTEQRRKKKLKERNESALKRRQQDKTKRLEELFSLKLKAFEIKEVRECSDKKLTAKIRASKSETEMNAWISVVLLKSYENESKEEN